MSFEKGDLVVLNDKHSEHDGDVGEITQVSETMFGDENYTVSFEDGKEHGVPADSLEAAPEDATVGEEDDDSEAASEDENEDEE